MNLTIKYSAFALVAMVVNLLSQALSLLLYQGTYALYVSILAGTASGLISKYLLDKTWIFAYYSDKLSDDINKLVAYSVTGVITTGVFWSFELGFEFIFATRGARYTGAIIGLTLGYVIKYQLDKRYVFSAGTV